jgi:hypothetical protein
MNDIKNFKSKKEDLKTDLKDNNDLNIPAIPIAPKKKEKISLDSPGLSTDLLSRIKALEKKDVKVVLVNCERCKEVIPVPIPIKSVKKSELPVVPISFVHKNPKKKDLHCITLHVDHDFDIRRQRISEVVLDTE